MLQLLPLWEKQYDDWIEQYLLVGKHHHRGDEHVTKKSHKFSSLFNLSLLEI
jgi:hypothetical protein